MAIIFNGTTVDKVIFNGAKMETVKFGGVVVFENKPQLATPQNVTADGMNVSWDEVENATSYDVLADGASIGTVTPSTAETWVLNETLNISGTTYFNNIEMRYSGQTRIPSIKSLKVYEYSDGPITAYEVVGEEQEEYAEGSSKYYLYQTGGGADGWQANSSGTKYNIWTFATAPTGDLFTWLQANGVKQ